MEARIKELREQINLYNTHYYSHGASPVTDADYDALYFELVDLEKRYPHLRDSHSPTQRIGAPGIGGFVKAKHVKKMLSLENTFTAAEVFAYLGDEDVVVEPKIDGASLELVYRDGRLAQAITRGIGTEGDDVTANARAILNVPLVINEAIDLQVTGEVYMTHTVFNDLNRRLTNEDAEALANPRNAAAAALKLKDPKLVSARKLSFVAYDSANEFTNFTQYQLMEHLAILGFQNVSLLPTTQSCQTVADNFQIETVEQLEQRIREADICRKFLDLPTDGLVFKLNNRQKQREAGEGNKYPNWACAFKFPAERKETVLLRVTVQVGRTGKMTPVAELQPVLLSGTTVKRASLCNQAEINRLNVDIGDIVLVEKSAEIIPKVVGVAQKVSPKTYTLPVHCPCCGTKLVCPEGYVDAYCLNDACSDQVFASILHGCSKAALDIDGCGDALVGELMLHGVKKLSDVFTVDASFLKPAARKRFELGRSACAQQPLWRKLHALGIEGFGQTLCQAVADRWRSLDEASAEPEAFCKLVGGAVYNNIVDYFQKKGAEFDALHALIGMTGTEQAVGPLTGKTFCITGDLYSGTRNEVALRIEAAGGVVKSSVTRHLSYLIQGTETGRTKRAAAEKNGIPIITEQQLFALMGQEMPTPKNTEEKVY